MQLMKWEDFEVRRTFDTTLFLFLNLVLQVSVLVKSMLCSLHYIFTTPLDLETQNLKFKI